MDLTDVFFEGYSKIQQYDKESQTNFLSTICELRGMPLISFKDFYPIFIPNDKYLLEFMDSSIKFPEYGVYNEDTCIWNNHLMFPLLNLNDRVKGFVSFDPFAYISVHQDGSNLNYYSYSSKNVMVKGRYMFGAKGTYLRALEDGVLFLTDGVFDTISVSELGFNVMALMGSVVTDEVAMQLRFVKTVVLLTDNDEAGNKLAYFLKRVHKNVVVYKQHYAKDVDLAIKSGFKGNIVKDLTSIREQNCLSNPSMSNAFT